MKHDNWPSPLKRYAGNPVLRHTDLPIESSAVFNAGAVLFQGKPLLVLRVEDYERRSHFYTARSDDGINFTLDGNEINYPLRPLEQERGVIRFDMRITPMDGTFYCYHCSWVLGLGSTVALAKTDDFVNFTPIGSCSTPTNRNALLFPEKIGGRYCRLERPEGQNQIMWISYSPDLIHWGDSRPISIPETSWNHLKNGAGTVPIRTKQGWLEIYHAVSSPPSDGNYYLGVCLLDLEDPSQVIATTRKFILAPVHDYECRGQVPNVVFTSGAVVFPDGKMNVYYGGADQCVALATTTIDELIDFCMR
jgi:beta-1,4-mannooligosaccharide/beta-1,4-mannosyl-N-acetylglucosamine phosphorylase